MSWLIMIWQSTHFVSYAVLLVFFLSVLSLFVEVYSIDLRLLIQGFQLWKNGKKNARKPLFGESLLEYSERINLL